MTTPDKLAKIKLARELREQGLSLRAIGERVGTSHTTVVKLLEEGRLIDDQVGLYQLAEERIRKLMRLEIFTDWLIDEYEMGATKGPAATYVPLLLKVERERALLTASDQAKLNLDMNGSVPVDALAVWEAVQEARARMGETEQ